MWLIFGFLAIVLTIVNLILYARGKDYKLVMALALSSTALTLAAEYRAVADWVRAEDWGALADVVPTMGKLLWVLTIMAVLLNIAPTILDLRKRP